MKKIISLSLVTALSTFLLVGCGASTSSMDVENENRTFTTERLTQEKVHKLIADAAKNAGWKITEFKSNSIIAERTDDGDTEAVTIKFDNSSFELSPENSDLQNVIEDALKI